MTTGELDASEANSANERGTEGGIDSKKGLDSLQVTDTCVSLLSCRRIYVEKHSSKFQKVSTLGLSDSGAVCYAKARTKRRLNSRKQGKGENRRSSGIRVGDR